MTSSLNVYTPDAASFRTVLGHFATGVAIITAIDGGEPVGADPEHWLPRMRETLDRLTGTAAAALGIILGLMMCFDLGGPVNKAAYVFATTGLTAAIAGEGGNQELVIMATVMAAGMVPPLAMALSSTLLPSGTNTSRPRQRRLKSPGRRPRPMRFKPPAKALKTTKASRKTISQRMRGAVPYSRWLRSPRAKPIS
jgi:hypothetical protein